MQILEAEHNLREIDGRELLLETADRLEEGVQVAAGEILHDKVQVVLGLEAEEELDDERMVGMNEDVALRHDALGVGAMPQRLVLALHLDRKEVARHDLARQVDTAEGALRDRANDLEVGDRRHREATFRGPLGPWSADNTADGTAQDHFMPRSHVGRCPTAARPATRGTCHRWPNGCSRGRSPPMHGAAQRSRQLECGRTGD